MTTDKDAVTHKLNHANIHLTAKALQKAINKLKYPIVLVMGGGSYGNLAPRIYNIQSPQDNWNKNNLLMMTVTMQGMLKEISEIFREYEIPVYPFQTSALFTYDEDGVYVNTEPMIRSMDIGCIPLLSGDLIFGRDRNFKIFSSDNIPVAIAEDLNLVNVLYYGDVPGVYHPFGSNEVVSVIDKNNFNIVLSSAGKSGKPDITGGMKNKLEQAKLLAQMGISSEILAFTEINFLAESITGNLHFGTRILAE